MNKNEYIPQLQVAVSQLHNCGALWLETVPVHEVFDLHDHLKAKRAYAWSHLDGEQDERTRFVAVLEIPPGEFARDSRAGSNCERRERETMKPACLGFLR